MASSLNDSQSTKEKTVGEIAATELQKICNDDAQSTESTELPGLTNTNDTNFKNIVFLDSTDNVNNPTTDSTDVPPRVRHAIDAYVETFGVAEEHLRSTRGSINTSTESDIGDILADGNTAPMSQFVSSTDEQQNQDQAVPHGLITTIDNLPIQTATERHIMISYNRDSSFDVCRQICHRLRNLGYNVWMDEDNLQGLILQGMAQGIKNSFIVLICYNQQYFDSKYCQQEATYTFDNRIDFIPCRLQASYEPDDWLGFIISGRLWVDFFPSNDFENSLRKLTIEIKHIEAGLPTYPNNTATLRSCDSNRTLQMNNQIMRDQFNTIIREYKESINKRNHDLHLLEKDELCELIKRLQERLFNDTLSTSDNDNINGEEQNLNNNRILRDLFDQSRTQTDLLNRITEILSKLSDFKTIIKLSSAFLFIWVVKTHIIDAYIKHK